MKSVDLAPHELHANLLFGADGLDPFFALDSTRKAAEGSRTDDFTIQGERWRVQLSYQDSNLIHPGLKTPSGTEFRLETIKEYRLKVMRHPDEDHIGKQKFTAHVAPRWPGMEGERSDGSRVEIPVPDGFGEGVNVRVQGANIAFDRYPRLLQQAALALGINARYFEDPHEYSNIQDAERYVRVHSDASGPVHARDGPLASMGHFLEHDRTGYRKIIQDDEDEHGRTLPGYYHTTTLGTGRIREAFPDHRLPKEVKHYYAKEALSMPEDHPLAHPNVGASLQTSLFERDETVHWSDRDRLRQELDQTVLSVLADAGLDVAPTDGVFVPDAYFEPTVSPGGPDPIGLDLTRIEQSQESIVVRHLADGLSPVQWETIETLVADGGELAPADLASETDRHVDSVRRALRDMEDLVHRKYAEVALRSDYVAEMLHEAVVEARDATRRAVDTAAKAAEVADRGLKETMSTFIAWAARHGIDVQDTRGARMTLRFGEAIDDHGRAIREGFRIWTDAGMPEEQYRSAQVQFADGGKGSAWRWLSTG